MKLAHRIQKVEQQKLAQENEKKGALIIISQIGETPEQAHKRQITDKGIDVSKYRDIIYIIPITPDNNPIHKNNRESDLC